MASSGAGINDDSFHSSSAVSPGAPAGGSEQRNASSQVSNSNFNTTADRPSRETTHHQSSSREAGRRERHNNNDDPSSRSAPEESPKLDGHRPGSRAHHHQHNSHHHQQQHFDHQSHGVREVRDGGAGDQYQLNAGISENPNADELVGSNNERITQRHSNTHRFSSTSQFSGTGLAYNHQCSNQTHTMPSTASSTTSGLISTSAASNSGSIVLPPSPPPTSLPNTLMSPSSGGSGIAVPGEDSDNSDFGQNEPSTSNSRARQKKFLKNFKQLPQEEVVLQRYSCALVSDILLQGHLYLTENYFAFYSNVFGYVTKLQIPIRSVTIVTKEKTAKIIPNAIGLMTMEHEKHVFSSFISRDTTFKLMTRLWKRAMRDLGAQEACIVDPQASLETELDVDEELIGDLPDDISSDSEDGGEHHHRVPVTLPVSRVGITSFSQTTPPITPLAYAPKDIMDSSYLVKRMSQSNGTIFYQKGGGLASTARGLKRSPTGDVLPGDINSALNGSGASLSTGTKNGNSGNLLSQLTKSTIVSIFVIVLLSFLFCSSLYLVFRIDSLQKQVESQGQHILGAPTKDESGLLQSQWTDILNTGSSEKMQKVLDSSVDQIAGVRKSLENLASLVKEDNKKEET